MLTLIQVPIGTIRLPSLNAYGLCAVARHISVHSSHTLSHTVRLSPTSSTRNFLQAEIMTWRPCPCSGKTHTTQDSILIQFHKFPLGKTFYNVIETLPMELDQLLYCVLIIWSHLLCPCGSVIKWAVWRSILAKASSSDLQL